MTGLGRVGILGGTFDPFHAGHIAVARTARTALALDEVRVVPSSIPPHRPQPLASLFHRFAMVALGIAHEPGVLVDDIEALADAPSYTAVTLERLHAGGFSALQLFFIIGADAFAEIATWRDYPRVLDATHFVVISRGGRSASSLPAALPALASRMRVLPAMPVGAPATFEQPSILLIDAPTPDVSSTTIRQRAANGASLDPLVDPLVGEHIRRHRLYQVNTPSSFPDAGHGRAASELHEQKYV